MDVPERVAGMAHGKTIKARSVLRRSAEDRTSAPMTAGKECHDVDFLSRCRTCARRNRSARTTEKPERARDRAMRG